MAAGLIIWDEYGRVVMDTTTRMGRILGFGTIGTADGSITPGGWDTGTLFFSLIPRAQGFETGYDYPTITRNTTSLFWAWGSTPAHRRANVNFVWGVY
ncbi:hypothetical protein KXR64_16705 [Brucella intermedia]|uniref:hypothetical protein n=1 Tax=Brucella TaxID=234 RepID=UPI00094674A6|nr:hypothetical protein [Brucella intermedia]